MKLTDKLNYLMKSKGLSRMGLAKKSGVPYTTIVNFYEKGTENVKLSTLKKLADFFNCSLDYLVDEDIEHELGISKLGELINLPIVGRISCGNGSLAFEDIEGYEPTPKEWISDGEYFYLRAKGDSMINARIQDGDLVLIRKQPEVNDGEIAAVFVEDEAYLKRVYRRKNSLILQSENPKYPPIICDPQKENCRIIGKLKRIIIRL